MEVMFMTFYTLELMVRLKVHGAYFFSNEEWNWNLLDFFLVMISLWDFLVSSLFQDLFSKRMFENGNNRSGFNMTFLRALRLIRMSKIFRILRVMRYFGELRMMLNCISMSIRPLFWCMLNIILFFFIFAISLL